MASVITDLERSTRVCSRCKIEKPLKDFHRSKADKVAGRQTYCAQCQNEARRERFEANPNYYRDIKLRHHYGVSYEAYEQMLFDQDGVCAICQNAETYTVGGSVRMLSVDHDHVTGAVRGLLCQKCNAAIGFFEDRPELLRRAADYVSGDRS